MKATIIPGLSSHDYHSLKSISKSGLDLIRRCPALYKYRRENPSEPTPAMRKGTLTHLAILEPDRFKSEIAVAPECDRRTTKGKELWTEFVAAHEGKEIITAQEFAELDAMRLAVWSHPTAGKLLEQIEEVETSIMWHTEGVDCRTRPDAITRKRWTLDLKTTSDASPEGFAKSVANYRYHVQDAFYTDARAHVEGEGLPFVFLCVETAPPFLVAVYTLPAEAKTEGRRLYLEDLATFRECEETGVWPGYAADKIHALEMPRWAMPREN